ncbi:MAG TPA: GNAT family N-acetyltransferase [Xanthobacteraceae bacterium]|nr:GNAT family N-acetyltransferase [Xanthobacteraceae bacterium]
MIAAAHKKSPTAITIRACGESDMGAITEIYAHHVLHGTASFELEPPSLEEMMRRHRAIVADGYVYLVAEAVSGIVGYAYVSAYRSRPAYRFTVENSVYVRAGHEGRGIGLRLMQALLAECEKKSFRQMIGVIGDSANHASIELHRKLGFHTIGTFRSCGFKFGRWVDSVLMQKELGAGDRTPPAAGT